MKMMIPLNFSFLVALVLVHAVLCSTSLADVHSDIRFRKFYDWFVENGGVANKVVVDSVPSMGLGIVSTGHIKSGDEILKIPLSIVFSSSSLAHSPDQVHVALSEILPTEEAVLFALLFEKLRGTESRFEPYISLLPQYVTSLVHFSEEELDQFQEAQLKSKAIQHQQLKKRLFDNSMSKLSSNANIPVSLLRRVDFNDYLWASTMVDSRGLRFHGRVYLSPFSDFFNYKPHPELRRSNAGKFYLDHHVLTEDYSGRSDAKQMLVVKADRDYDTVGSQVFEDYGDNDDHIYTVYHGFLPFDNPFRCYPVHGVDKVTLPTEAQRFLEDLGFTNAVPPSSCLSPTLNCSLDKGFEVYSTASAMTAQQMEECTEVMVRLRREKKPISAVYADCKLGDSYLQAMNLLNELKASKSRHFDKSSPAGRVLSSIQHAVKSSVNPLWRGISTKDDLDQIDMITGQFDNAHEEQDRISLEHQLLAVRYRVAMKETYQKIKEYFLVDDDDHHEDEAHKQPHEVMVAPDGSTLSVEKKTSVTTTEDDAQVLQELEEFNAWFKAAVDDVHRNALSAKDSIVMKIEAALIPGFRIGTRAIADIAAETTYLGVPDAVIMDADKAVQDPRVGLLIERLNARYSNRDTFHELLFFLLSEKFVSKETSKYWPYLRLLPAPNQLDIPLLWSAEVVEERLGPSDIASSVHDYHAKVRKAFEFIAGIKEVQEHFKIESAEGNNHHSNTVLTYDNYAWANAILDSRSIWWKNERHLVPMLDFVNCALGPEPSKPARVHGTSPVAVKMASSGEVQDIAVTKAAWTFKEGQQVFENYGQPNHIYFTYHGFVLPNNSHDCLHLEFKMSNDELDGLKNRAVAADLGQKLGVRNMNAHQACVREVKDIRFATWFFVAMKADDIDSFIQAKGRPSDPMLSYFENNLKSRRAKYATHSTSHTSSSLFLESEVKLIDNLIQTLESLLLQAQQASSQTD